MAEGTTLLSYEMGWQLRLFDLMAASQQANDYMSAINYGIGFLSILGLQDKIPERKLPEKGGASAELESLQNYYFEILMVGIGKIANTIANVRVKYNKDKDVPSYRREVKVTN